MSHPRVVVLVIALLASAFGSSLQAARPNVIVILVDDMGYSDLGCYGGEIETPHIDSLASGGLRFSQFYNQGRCCPTRASLMTGLQPHQVGIGHMTLGPEQDLGITGPYQGYLNNDCATIAEVLRGSGYQTFMTGKWHLGNDRAECYPLQRGFDRYYGCLSGAINYFRPGGNRGLTDGNDSVSVPADFYATDTFTQKAIEFLRQSESDRPFFLYLAYNAPHWPLNAKWVDYQKYRGRYRGGWHALMKARNQRQREIGVLDPSTRIAPFPGPDWDELSPSRRDRLDAIMAAYAGCLDNIDQNVGELLGYLKQSQRFENTVILFLSDNGACQEGGNFGKGDEAMIRNPPLETTGGVRLGLHWAGACNTPYRKYKHYVHEGGARTPMIVHWPAGIPESQHGHWVRPFAMLQDIFPTFLELAEASYPDDVPPLRGRSMLPLWKGGEKPIHTEPVFWEHEGNAAMRDADWKLVREYEQPWELYDLSVDPTELNNLADTHPDRRDQMIAAWKRWATQTGVSFPKRFNMYEALKRQAKESQSS